MKTIILLLFSTASFANLFPLEPDKLCFEYAKSLIKTNFNETQLNELKENCRFNNKNFCLYEITKDIPSRTFDDIDELTLLTKSCQYVRPKCVGIVKKYLNQDQYSNYDSITQITSICVDTSYKCLDYECSQPENKCRTLKDLERFVPNCLR